MWFLTIFYIYYIRAWHTFHCFLIFRCINLNLNWTKLVCQKFVVTSKTLKVSSTWSAICEKNAESIESASDLSCGITYCNYYLCGNEFRNDCGGLVWIFLSHCFNNWSTFNAIFINSTLCETRFTCKCGQRDWRISRKGSGINLFYKKVFSHQYNFFLAVCCKKGNWPRSCHPSNYHEWKCQYNTSKSIGLDL